MQPFYPIGCTGDVCDPAGAAIYQIGGTVYIQDNLGSAGNNNSNANYSNYSFKNCKYGLYASRVFATVLRQTDIVACDYGVYIENSAADQNGGGGIILIEGNQIGKREIDASAGISTIKKIGVHLYQCDPMWYTEIAKNNIVVSDNASKGHESVGILLSGHGSTYGSGAIESNQIWAYNAVAGLGLLSIDKTYLHNNTINLTDATTNIAGMLLYAANATRMDCNTVTNYSLQTPNVFDEYGTRAYNIIASEGGSYDCNSSSGTYTGWLFQEPCIVNSKTTWANNHIGDHHWGVNFGGSLTINEFPHQGNTWWGQYTKAARHEGNINFFTGKVQGAIGANGNNLQQYPNPATMIETTYPGVTPANWFYDDWHQIPSCAASTQGVCSWWSLTGNGGDDNNMANQIAEGNINTAEYPAEVKRMEQLALYEKLRDGDIQNPTTAMWELKDSLDQTQAAAYYLTDQKTENVSKLAAAQKTQADLFLNSLKTTFGNLKQLDSLRQADTAQTAFYKTQATAKLHDLSNTNAQYKAFAQALEAARDTKSRLAKTANTGLTAIELYEQNTKTTTDIYLSTIGKGHSNFTPQQAADLQTVANQCPLTGGPAVHEARAMASKLGFKVHNDKALCAVQGVNYRAVKPKEEVKETLGLAFNVYPNPADGIVNIQANQALAGDGELQIYDIYGRLTVRMPLINNTNGLGFDVTAWTAGQYAYKIILSNGYTSIGKFIVVK
jgi:hypothetical protein